MNKNIKKRLYDISNNVDDICITVIKERIKYGKYSNDVYLNIDNAIRFVGQDDEFTMVLSIGKHKIMYSNDQVIYYYKTSSKIIYDIVELPDINNISLDAASYFQYSTIYDFKYFELKDLLALDKIRIHFQTIWANHILRW